MTTPANQPDLIAWLRAQLDDDERVARRAGGIRDLEWTYDRETFHVISGRGQSIAARKPEGNPINDVDGEPIARHDPARALAEVDAKRRILDLAATVTDPHDDEQVWYQNAITDVIRRLAVPFAGHPDYREEWRP